MAKERGGSAWCACVRVCVWRGRDVDEERALFLSHRAQLILLSGAGKRQSQRWIPREGDAQSRRRSRGEARVAAKESRAGEKSNLCSELGFFFANAKGNMQHIFAFFCTSFLGVVLGANFPNNIQIGECGARGRLGAMFPGKKWGEVGPGGGGEHWPVSLFAKGKMCVCVWDVGDSVHWIFVLLWALREQRCINFSLGEGRIENKCRYTAAHREKSASEMEEAWKKDYSVLALWNIWAAIVRCCVCNISGCIIHFCEDALICG